jgi:hypothetical protein
MAPAEVVLLDTLKLVVAAAYVDGETGGEVLAVEPVVLGKVLVVTAGCELEDVSTADGGDTGAAECVEDDVKSGVDAVPEGELDAGAVGRMVLSKGSNEVSGGRLDDCPAEFVGAVVGGGDSIAEL